MNQQQENDLIASASLFIKTLTDIEGADRGMELWDRIADVIGSDIKGKIFFSLLTSNFGTIIINPIHATELKEVAIHKVSIVKCIRLYTGLGLKEAIAILNQILDGQSVKLSVDPKDTIRALNELRTYGIKA